MSQSIRNKPRKFSWDLCISKEEPSVIIMFAIAWFGAILAVWLIILKVSSTIIDDYWRSNVEYYIQTANMATTAELKHKYLTEYAKALKAKSLDRGQAKWLFKAPSADLAEKYKTLQLIIEKLGEIAKLDPESAEYQYAFRQIVDNELKWFDSCVFAEGWRRQSVIRWLATFWGLTCTNGAEQLKFK